MKGLREIRARIRSVKSTAQLTHAMELISSSKMKKAQEHVMGSRMYTYALADILHSLTRQVSLQEVKHPFLEEREIEHRGILLVTSERGLCGAFNQSLLREALRLPGKVRFIVMGQKGVQGICRSRAELLGQFACSDEITFCHIQEIVHFLIDAYQKHTIDTVEVLFPRFKNTLSQEPTLRRLLPMTNFEEELARLYQWMGIDPLQLQTRDYDFIVEPDGKAILERLPTLFLKKTLYQVLLETKASEHSARMVAMHAATDNAETLIEDLQREYNKARQASVTQEIVEITASRAT
jgi:F-type H+-transporting ATPase subunit gamma